MYNVERNGGKQYRNGYRGSHDGISQEIAEKPEEIAVKSQARSRIGRPVYQRRLLKIAKRQSELLYTLPIGDVLVEICRICARAFLFVRFQSDVKTSLRGNTARGLGNDSTRHVKWYFRDSRLDIWRNGFCTFGRR